jgi:transposase
VNQAKYIGMDVHQATISVAVMDSAGKLILESILETKAATILQFIGGLHGSLLATFEEGTSAAWLYDLLKPHVANVLVCDPRKNALLKDGSKSDRIDAGKLAELLRGNHLSPIVLVPRSAVREKAGHKQSGTSLRAALLCRTPTYGVNGGGTSKTASLPYSLG